MSLETDERDILQVLVDAEDPDSLEEDSCESCEGLRVTVHEFLLLWR
jgi:hypothetical protein